MVSPDENSANDQLINGFDEMYKFWKLDYKKYLAEKNSITSDVAESLSFVCLKLKQIGSNLQIPVSVMDAVIMSLPQDLKQLDIMKKYTISSALFTNLELSEVLSHLQVTFKQLQLQEKNFSSEKTPLYMSLDKLITLTRTFRINTQKLFNVNSEHYTSEMERDKNKFNEALQKYQEGYKEAVKSLNFKNQSLQASLNDLLEQFDQMSGRKTENRNIFESIKDYFFPVEKQRTFKEAIKTIRSYGKGIEGMESLSVDETKNPKL